MLGLGCLTVDGFQPRQLKNAPPAHFDQHAAVLREGDLLVSRANTRDLVGLAGIYRDVGVPCIYPDLMMRLRTSDLYLPEFLELVLRAPESRRRIVALAQGTSESMVKISGAALSRIAIPDVPVSEQRRIVEVIDAVSVQERAIKASIAKLRSVRQGALLASLAAIEGGDSPMGWARVPLKDVVPTAEYGISEALDRDPQGVPVLRMNNLQEGRPELSELRYSPVPAAKRLELRFGDVLFNRTNSIDHIGKSGMWRDEIPRATFASYLVRINPDRSRLTPEYLVEWLMHPVIRQRVRSISTVAVQQVNVNPTRLRELEIDIPVDLAEQRRIVDSLHSCDSQIEDEREELAKLRALKLGLVDDLLAGEA
jgi:type I restriction enzyme S subunit